MDRYRMVLKKEPKPLAYRFRTSNSIIRVSEYIVKCITDGINFDASNLNETILDSALIRVSKELSIPIVVASEITERVLRMTYGYKKIYSPKNIPDIVFRVICYYNPGKIGLSNKEIVLVVLK